MAKISVTDDQGTLIEQFTDEGEEIGNLDRPMAKSSLINQIAHAVSRARGDDGRNEWGEPHGVGGLLPSG